MRMVRFVLVCLLTMPALCGTTGIFPQPRAVIGGTGEFSLDESVVIATPPNASAADRFSAAFLSAELSDRYGLALRSLPLDTAPQSARTITVGSVENPWLRKLALDRKLTVGNAAESYSIEVTPSAILVCGRDAAGAFYGVQSLRQLLGPAGTRIAAVTVNDTPASPFRGIKMYLPGRENIGFFKRFVRDFMAQYKFNKLILEVNAGMRLDRHPELNAGWIELGRDLRATRRERTRGPRGETQDSVHVDTADFGVLEKAEVAELAAWARQHHIEVIPEIASLSHSYYLLARHRELAEIPDAEWPDTYCPRHPGSRQLLFDVIDEYVDVLRPAMVHIGHDEWRIPWGVCKRCRDEDPRLLFAEDVNKVYEHLKAKGVSTAMWGDHLIEPLRGIRVQDRKTYQTPGALSPAQAKELIPKDILMFNWFWNETYARTGQGEGNDAKLADWGFQQVYGNMTPGVQNYVARSGRRGVLGGAPSSWAGTTPFNFGKDLLSEFLGCAGMLWSRESSTPEALSGVVDAQLPRLDTVFRTGERWSALKEPVVPIPLTGKGSGAVPEIVPGVVKCGKLAFEVRGLLYGPTSDIAINHDASSLVFLHASEQRGASAMAYRAPHNFADTADLLGWYEVEYEDGYVITIPLRAEVNILDWDRASRKDSTAYAYAATPVDIPARSGHVTFYALEWANPRLGKVIRQVRLKNTTGFKRTDGHTASNRVVLAGVSYVPKREARGPKEASAMDE